MSGMASIPDPLIRHPASSSATSIFDGKKPQRVATSAPGSGPVWWCSRPGPMKAYADDVEITDYH